MTVCLVRPVYTPIREQLLAEYQPRLNAAHLEVREAEAGIDAVARRLHIDWLMQP